VEWRLEKAARIFAEGWLSKLGPGFQALPHCSFMSKPMTVWDRLSTRSPPRVREESGSRSSPHTSAEYPSSKPRSTPGASPATSRGHSTPTARGSPGPSSTRANPRSSSTTTRGRRPIDPDQTSTTVTHSGVSGSYYPRSTPSTASRPQPPRNPTRYAGTHAQTGPPPEERTRYGQEHQHAASKIGALGRGWRERKLVADRVAEKEDDDQVLDPEDLGLGPYAEFQPGMASVSDELRYGIRDITARRALMQCGLQDTLTDGYFSFPDSATSLLCSVEEAPELLPNGVQTQLKTVHLFVDDLSESIGARCPSANGTESNNKKTGYVERRHDLYLLGKFDGLLVPAKADFGNDFQQISKPLKTESPLLPGHVQDELQSLSVEAPGGDCDGSQGFDGWFFVYHAAAPNIGESAQADDFVAYSKETEEDSSDGSTRMAVWHHRPLRPTRRLDLDMYLKDMGRLWENALKAMGSLGIQDAIFFPFGMGAFLRHLWKNDDYYADARNMKVLRRGVADTLMAAIAKLCLSRGQCGPQRVHLCLVVTGGESVQNHNAFVAAAGSKAKTCPDLTNVLRIRRNVDCLQLAHQLAHTPGKPPLTVAILNGANRKLVGNHWFSSGARFAIDENLHRRSASMARAALLLNFDYETRPRKPNYLRETVEWFGGNVKLISECKAPSTHRLMSDDHAESGTLTDEQRTISPELIPSVRAVQSVPKAPEGKDTAAST